MTPFPKAFWPRSGAGLSALAVLTVLTAVLPAASGPAQPSGTAPGLSSLAAAGRSGAGTAALERRPLHFIENRGQVDARVSHYVQGEDKSVYFTSEGLTYALVGPADDADCSAGKRASDAASTSGPRNICPAAALKRWAVKLDFAGANRGVRPTGRTPLPAVFSYFKGPRTEWKTGARSYGGLLYSGLWDGIDLELTGTEERLKYTFMVAPGADPGRIRLTYRGAGVALTPSGWLRVTTPLGSFVDQRPIAFQYDEAGRRLAVEAAYRFERNRNSDGDTAACRAGAEEACARAASTYGFALGGYDPALPLFIDPAVLVYSGYIGGAASESGAGLAVDAEGAAYVAGDTFSSAATFPAVAGPDLTFNGVRDVFVAKINPSGTALVYAGYLGGEDLDVGRAIAVDGDGNAYVTGETRSADFPAAAGPDATHNGAVDAFVAKISPAGTALLYSGFVGGESNDAGRGIAVDADGRATITGETFSAETSFPVTVGPDLTANGSSDAFVGRLSPEGSRFLYLGYVGGVAADVGRGVALDAQGQAFLTGETFSAEDSFPVTGGPSLTAAGGGDAFVAKVSAGGLALDYAGYLGGAGSDAGHAIAVGRDGGAYVTGATDSGESTFPVTRGPDLTHNGGMDAFVAKVNPVGDAFVYAGYLGGAANDFGRSIGVDGAGSAYVAGDTFSTEETFPAIAGPFLTAGGSGDVFVSRVNLAGTALIFSGFYGGEGSDSAGGVALHSGAIHLAGTTSSPETSFPLEAGPELTFNGMTDAFAARFTLEGPLISEEGIVNAASFLGGPVAPGGILSLFGVGLGPETGRLSRLDEEGKVAALLAGVEVLFDGVPAPLFFVREDQINCQAPYEIFGTETVSVQVIVEGRASNTVEIEVAEAAPGLFTLESSGAGQAVALVFPDNVPNGPDNRVPPGGVVTLFGTGEGQTEPEGVTGKLAAEPLPAPLLETRLSVGGAPAEILFSGPAPGFAGLWQINARLADDTPQGSRTPLTLTIGGLALTPESRQARLEQEVFLAIGEPGGAGGVTAQPQSVMTAEDTPLAVTLTGGGPEGEELTFSITRQPVNGVLSGLTSNGSSAMLTYTPAEDFNGPDSLEFQVRSPGGAAARAEVEIEVKPVEDPPVANDDTAATSPGANRTIDVLRNDFDPDGDSLVIASFTQPANGNVARSGDRLRYTPGEGFTGEDMFSYTINDGNGNTDSAAVTVDVREAPGDGEGDDQENEADLGIEKTPETAPVIAGQQTAYTLKVTNNGPAEATGVTVTDTFPAELSHVSNSCGAAVSGNTLTWTLGSLPAIAMRTCSVTFEVSASASGNIVNQALVAGNEPDPFAPNDAAATVNPVELDVTLSVTKAAAGNLKVGATADYLITVNHAGGASNANNMQVTDVLPPLLTFVPSGSSPECSAPGLAPGETVTCVAPAPIPPGGSVLFTIRVMVGSAP